MRIVIPDDYQNAVRGLACFSKLAGHEVTVFTDTVRETDALVERFEAAEAFVLIRERTPIRDELLARLPRLKLISQTGKGTSHIDVVACTRRGIVVAAGTGSPYATAELTWALVLASRRHIPYETARLRAGHWQSTMGLGLRGRTLVDVYEEEPILGAAHPLLSMDNAVCTPHLGYVEKDGYELYFGQAFDQLLRSAS